MMVDTLDGAREFAAAWMREASPRAALWAIRGAYDGLMICHRIDAARGRDTTELDAAILYLDTQARECAKACGNVATIVARCIVRDGVVQWIAGLDIRPDMCRMLTREAAIAAVRERVAAEYPDIRIEGSADD